MSTVTQEVLVKAVQQITELFADVSRVFTLVAKDLELDLKKNPILFRLPGAFGEDSPALVIHLNSVYELSSNDGKLWLVMKEVDYPGTTDDPPYTEQMEIGTFPLKKAVATIMMTALSEKISDLFESSECLIEE